MLFANKYFLCFLQFQTMQMAGKCSSSPLVPPKKKKSEKPSWKIDKWKHLMLKRECTLACACHTSAGLPMHIKSISVRLQVRLQAHAHNQDSQFLDLVSDNKSHHCTECRPTAQGWGGGGLLTRLWIGVCTPGWHTLTLPRQKFPTLLRKKVKLQPLPEFQYQTRIQTHPLPDCWAWKQHPSQTESMKNIPLPDCWAENSTLPRQKLEKNIPLRAAHPQYTKYSQRPPQGATVIITKWKRHGNLETHYFTFR